HTEGFADIMMLRWYFKGPRIDIVCSSDAASVPGFTNSCRKYVTHIADAFIQSGEIAERRSEDNARLAGGPADLTNVMTFDPKDEPQGVWSLGDVKVSAIRSTHTAGHAHGAVIHDRWKVQGGPLTEADYRKAVEASGFTGITIVGTDLATLRLPPK